MANTGWWAFVSTIPGRSYVKFEQTPRNARNESIVSGTKAYGPYSSQQQATAAMHRPPAPKVRGSKKKQANSPSGAYIVTLARSWLGVPYQYGGTSRHGVDCSGLVLNVAQEAGIKDCPRTSEEQWAWCEHIHEADAGAGDLIFFIGAEIDPPPGHVSIIVHPGLVISADQTGTNVRYDRYDPNGTGIAHVIGYGRLRGVTPSRTANLATAGTQGGASALVPLAAGQSITGLIATGVVFFFVVALLVALVLLALWFKGM